MRTYQLIEPLGKVMQLKIPTRITGENISRISKDYGKDVLHNFLAQYTPENRNRTEDWEKIKYHIGDSLGLEKIIYNIKGEKNE